MPLAQGKNGTIIAVALLIVAGGLFYYLNARPTRKEPKAAWFVDEETGEEMNRPLTDVPPLPGKSGKPTVVREFKYSDDGGRTTKVAYYFKFTDETKQRLDSAIAAGKNPSDIDANPGELVRSPQAGSKWVSLGSDEGQSIAHVAIPRGKESEFVIVTP